MYFFLPIISSIFWSTINIIDDYLVKMYTDGRSVSILMVYSTLIGFPIFLILFAYSSLFAPQPLSYVEPSIIFQSFIAGVTYIFGVYFYLKSLDMSNASVVMPQLLMIPVFSLFLGYFILNENVTFGGLLGILLIIWGSVLINIERDSLGGLLMNKRLLLFSCLASFFLAMNSFSFKYIVLIGGASYLNVLAYEHLGFFICGVFILLYQDNFTLFVRSTREYGVKILSLNIVGELLNVFGNSIFHLATLYIPLAYAHASADGSQPFIVLAMTYLAVKFSIINSSALPKRGYLYTLTCISIIFLGLMCLYF